MSKLNKTALCILATGEYHVGARVMFHTLEKYGGLPSEVDRYVIGSDQCEYARSCPVVNDYSRVRVSAKNFPEVAKKFQALTLPYRRIILMDADMLCVGDCSYLWSDAIVSLPFYACRDTASEVYYGQVIRDIELDFNRIFNAGTMVFNFDHLRSDFHDHLLGEIQNGLRSYDEGDQGYLNTYFQRWAYEIGVLPAEYNESYDKNMPSLPDHAKRVIHFTGKNANPWAPRLSSGDPRHRWVKQWQREYEECR